MTKQMQVLRLPHSATWEDLEALSGLFQDEESIRRCCLMLRKGYTVELIRNASQWDWFDFGLYLNPEEL